MKTSLKPWNPIKTDLEQWKPNLELWKTIKTNLELHRVVTGGYRTPRRKWWFFVTDRQTDTSSKYILTLATGSAAIRSSKERHQEMRTKLILYPNPHHHILHCCHRFIVSAAPCHSTTALATSPAPLLVFCMEPLSSCLAQGFADFGAPCDPKIKKKTSSFNGGDCVTAIENEKCTSIYGERQINNINLISLNPVFISGTPTMFVDMLAQVANKEKTRH